MFSADLPDPRLPSLRESSNLPSHEPFIIEKDGEMPEGAISTSASSSRRHTPALPELSAPTPLRVTSFPEYEVPGEDGSTRTSTPDAIKVTRAKKKGTGKKKRTQNLT